MLVIVPSILSSFTSGANDSVCSIYRLDAQTPSVATRGLWVPSELVERTSACDLDVMRQGRDEAQGLDLRVGDVVDTDPAERPARVVPGAVHPLRATALGARERRVRATALCERATREVRILAQ
jgi:hypothetical protein